MAALARNCAGLPSGQWHATFRSGSVPQKLLAALASRLRANVQTEAASVNLVKDDESSNQSSYQTGTRGRV